MRRQNGFTLVECLVTMSLIATTFAAVGVALSGMYRANRSVRQELRMQRELERFAAQFRADSHLALAVEERVEGKAEGGRGKAEDRDLQVPEPASGVLLLSLAERRSVQYTLQPGRVDRLLRDGDAVSHRETYRLPKSLVAKWRVARDRSLPMASLVLEPKPGVPGSPLAPLASRVDAAVGLLQPLTGSEGGRGKAESPNSPIPESPE